MAIAGTNSAETIHQVDGATPAPARLVLPDAPVSETAAVKVWSEPVTMLTYHPGTPDRNPLFLEKRVYQGSSGRVYPLPVIDSVASTPELHDWQAVHLENEFVRLMVLPEVGGRIHIGLDKRTGYDFFYRQNVMKPALVGLAGPWASGGVEFNWPQHHRPATYMPVEVSIEREADGAVTVWCSDHDPMVHMKGMHGLRLRPGLAMLEVRVRLYNRTTDTQTFLWWANVATRVHELYQSFFPRDAHFAADHAKRALTTYPLSEGTYYGINYGARVYDGVPDNEQPSQFVPDGSYAPNDLGWYANIPVPTSYMIVGSRGDYSGGYDHKAHAGTVAIGNHHIAPGKKQWTWGNHEFGYAWDRTLTDNDGPYVELMSGVYTDNQPDFSFLAPGETKTFSQFWYPISEIGVPDLADLAGALRVEILPSALRVHLQMTSDYPASLIRLEVAGREAGVWHVDLQVDAPLHHDFAFVTGTDAIQADNFVVTVEQSGNVLLRYAPAEIVPADPPELATEPPLPEDVETADELFLTGLHLEQYRHPTRSAESYWLEAVRRDPGDSRANHALGRSSLRRGLFAEAERYLRTAIKRITARNPNPYDGEAHYNLGLTLLYLGRASEAYDAFYKSTWNAAWRGPAYARLAELDTARHEWPKALDHLDRSLRADADNLNVRNLRTIVLRRLDRHAEAEHLLAETRALDPLDIFSRWLATGTLPASGQQRLDLIFDLARAGLYEDALSIATAPHIGAPDGTSPLLLYAQADLLRRLGREEEAAVASTQAAAANPNYVFPSRLEELVLLESAILAQPNDARAPYYLGNQLYDRRRYAEAIELWERATTLDPDFPTAWRNLGIACFNIQHNAEKARAAFAYARELAPEDARILYEQHQLAKRLGDPLAKRLGVLDANLPLVAMRDDLSLEFISLYNSTGQPEKALQLLGERHFQVWEGGEGLVLGQYVRANVLLAQQAIAASDARAAIEHLSCASNPPRNLSEAKHPLMNLSMIDFWLGEASSASGDPVSAAMHWERAAQQKGDFQQMQVQQVSEMTYWTAMALRRLGREAQATALFRSVRDHALALERAVPTIDYFATSLPTMLLFEESLADRQKINALFLQAQVALGLGDQSAGLALLDQVQALDRSHPGAIDLRQMYRA